MFVLLVADRRNRMAIDYEPYFTLEELMEILESHIDEMTSTGGLSIELAEDEARDLLKCLERLYDLED
jgi:hypothetical protein